MAMNKEEIANILSQRTGFTKKDSELTLDVICQIITEALSAGKKIQISNFGTFEMKRRAPRVGRNPSANTPVHIPAKQVPNFRPGKALRDLTKISE